MKKKLSTVLLALAAFMPMTAQNFVKGDYGYLYCHMSDKGEWTAGSSFDTRMLCRIEDRFTIINVLIVVAITRYSIRGPFSLITHVTIEITIITLYKILCCHWHESSQSQEYRSEERR